MAKHKSDLVKECVRQTENCLYTSTALFIWLRRKRTVKAWFIVLPIIFGSLSTFQLISESQEPSLRILVSVFAFIGGVMPAVFAGLKYDDDLEKCKMVAAEFKNLQDKFRQIAIIGSKKNLAEFEEMFAKATERMEEVRRESITPPEWAFKAAQKKVQSGDYTFDVDTETYTD